MRQRRKFTREFKLFILSKLGVKSSAEISRKHNLQVHFVSNNCLII